MGLCLSENMTIEEISSLPEFSRIRDLLFTHPDEEKQKSRLCDYGIRKENILPPLAFAAEFSRREDFFLPLYTEDEIRKDPSLSEAFLLNFICHPDAPVCIICPGGGYNREWVLVEGYPMAQALSEKGINPLILIYRTGFYGLLPRPMEDLQRAVSLLISREKRLGCSMEGYAVMGASAGGHLCAMWGTAMLGSRHYHLPAPASILLMYPAANLSLFYDRWEKQADEETAVFLRRVGGEHFTREDVLCYSLDRLIDSLYPPTYLVHAMDDPVVPVENSRLTEELLIRFHIPHKTRFAGKAGHSFGLGIGTDAQGWMEEAIDFYLAMRNQENKEQEEASTCS